MKTTAEIMSQFRAEREIFDGHVSVPIDNERSKLSIGDDRKIKGYALVWGEKNDYNEIFVKGSTLNSLNARGVGASKNQILILNQHKRSQILARPSALQEDETGLYFEAEIIKGTQYADEAVAQVRQGVLNQLSVGFNYIWDKVEFDPASDAYVIREMKLYEISLVSLGSSPSAQLRSYRDFQLRAIISKYGEQEIRDFQTILSSMQGAATSTPAAPAATSAGAERPEERAVVDCFTETLKLF
jgi:HK97 family phage prohead protease